MYCPKCAELNRDELAFCRSCGEDLQVVGQAMKKHLAVTIAGRFDAALDKKHEVFRRDAALGLVMSVAIVIAAGLSPTLARLNVLFILLGVFGSFLAAWNYLAYRRSLEILNRSLAPSSDSVSLNPSGSPQTGGAGESSVSRAVHAAYCPKCGTQNSEKLTFCQDCGTFLNFEDRPRGLEKYLPSFLLERLDAKVIENEIGNRKPRVSSGWVLLGMSAIFLLNVVVHAADGDWAEALLWLVIGLTTVVTGGWSLISYRRDLEKRRRALNESHIGPQPAALFGGVRDTSPLTSAHPHTVTEAETKPLNSQEEGKTRILK